MINHPQHLAHSAVITGMERAVELQIDRMQPSMPRDYVVPMPRITDALGQSLRHAFAPLENSLDLDRLLQRLDAAR